MTVGTHHTNGKHVGDRIDRGPPHNPAAEQALLGSMLRDKSIIPEAIRLVRATDHYASAHNILQRAFVELHASGKAANIVTVGERLTKNEIVDIAGHRYLADPWDAAPAAANYRQYAEIIVTDARRRGLLQLGREIEAHAADRGAAVAEKLAVAESLLLELGRLAGSDGYRYYSITSAAFAKADLRPEWLVKRVAVRNQPGGGGPSKTLKTTTVADFAISLGTEGEFLGYFDVPRPMRVVIISGESGEFTLQETVRRIGKAKGIGLEDTFCYWAFDLPRLANPLDIAELRRGLIAVKAEIVIIDPLCLSLLSGGGRADIAKKVALPGAKLHYSRIMPDVRQHRAELVICALTILKAYSRAGRPKPIQMPTFGSFEKWSEIVRGAAAWVTGHDLPLVYEELRQLARQKIALEKPGQTLRATALVHEAFLRLVDVEKVQRWDSRGHFFAAAAQAMRRILIEAARRKGRHKRGGSMQRLDRNSADLMSLAPPDELLIIDDALNKLAAEDADAAQLVKLRYFAGLSIEEAAEFSGISRSSAYEHWAFARAWLHNELMAGTDRSSGVRNQES